MLVNPWEHRDRSCCNFNVKYTGNNDFVILWTIKISIKKAELLRCFNVVLFFKCTEFINNEEQVKKIRHNNMNNNY